MRVAVTGAAGRLGSALVDALGDAPFTGPAGPIAWTRADFDLDAPGSIGRLLDRDRPEVVIHTAAWTDVDGCARDPDLAIRRNAVATGEVAIACASHGVDLLVISTNEVFDGMRDDGRPYPPDAPLSPSNAYGVSKAKGEEVARAAYVNREGAVGVVRTAWLYGPPGNDFPTKIVEAAERARAENQPLRVVADEWGQPTLAADVAEAVVDLLSEAPIGGTHHFVNTGIASRAEWARELFHQLGLAVEIEQVPASTWQRASTPPRWGVLEATTPPSGEPMRPWQTALADYVPLLRRRSTAAR